MNDKIDVNLMNKTLIDPHEDYGISEWFDFWFFSDCDNELYINDIYIDVKKTSLYRAVEIGNIEIVNLLLINNKIDVNLKNNYHKYIRQFNGDAQVAVNLDRTALNLAIINENIEIVKLLLAHDSIDINLINYDVYYANDAADGGHLLRKATLIIFAIENDNVEIVKMLLMNNKIDVNIKLAISECTTNNSDDFREYTPLSLAITHKNFDIIDLLLMNKKLDLNSSSIIYYEPEIGSDIYWKYHYYEYGKRKEFTKVYEQPYIKRYSVGSEEKNRDLLKKFALEKNINLNARIKKLLE